MVYHPPGIVVEIFGTDAGNQGRTCEGAIFFLLIQADRAYGTEISPRSFVISFVILLYAISYNIGI